MNIDHIGVYVYNLEKAKTFFETYFHAKANQLYHNKETGLKTYFLSFANHARLEIMNRPDLDPIAYIQLQEGFHHLAFGLDSKEKVDILTKTLKKDGYLIVNGPRTTGDGYYETLFKFESLLIELVYKP